MTPDPGRRAQRGLAAAVAKRDAGALDAATALLAAVGHGPPDARRMAEVWRLRGQLALDQQRGADAAQYLLRAARALEPVDIQLARQTYLEALGAAIGPTLDRSDVLVERLSAARAVRPVRSRCAPSTSRSMRSRCGTEGFSAAAPSLIRALDVLRGEPWTEPARALAVADDQQYRRHIALELFESEARYALDVAQVEAARAKGALMQLRVGLHYLAHANLLAGELARRPRKSTRAVRSPPRPETRRSAIPNWRSRPSAAGRLRRPS